jgi:hypothetical protein
MRITDSEGRPLWTVYLALSDEEARELADALRNLESARPGWHEHISAADHQTEVTVYREDDTTTAF